MAIPTDLYSPEQFRFALAPQANWGTAETDDADYFELWLTNKPMPDWSGATRQETKLSNGSLIADVSEVFVDELGAHPTFALEGRVTLERLNWLIYGVTQSVPTESTPTAYKRTYTLDENLRGLVGIVPKVFFSAAFYDPASGVRQRLINCVIKSLELSGVPGTEGGLVTFKAELQSFGPADRAATLVPGSWGARGDHYLPWSKLQLRQLGGSDLLIASWKLMLSNGCAPSPSLDSSGNADTIRFGAFEQAAEVKTKHDAVSKALLANWLTNPADGAADLALALRYFGASDDFMFGFTLNSVQTTDPKHDFGDAAGVMRTLAFKGMSDLENGTDALVLTEANTVQMAWS